ncbi:hypothetical protein ACIPSQ_20835, partial [Pectobacterium parvum]
QIAQSGLSSLKVIYYSAQLFSMEMVVVATPDHFFHYGFPQTPADLAVVLKTGGTTAGRQSDKT